MASEGVTMTPDSGGGDTITQGAGPQNAVKIARGSVYLLTSNILSTLAGLLTFPLVVRILPPTEYGAITGILLVSNFANAFGDLGFSNAVTKYVAEYKGANRDYNSTFMTYLIAKVFTGLVMFLGIYLFSGLLSSVLLRTSVYSHAFVIISLNVFLGSVGGSLMATLYGLGKIKELAALNSVKLVLSSCLVLVFVAFGLGLNGVALGWTVPELVGLAIVSLFLRHDVHLTTKVKFRVTFRTLFGFSWPLYALGIFGLFSGNLDQIFLLAYVPLDKLATYRVALTAASYAAIFLGPIGTAIFPYFASMTGKEDWSQISNSIKESTRYVTLIYTPVALGLMSMTVPLLSIFAGDRYVLGSSVLVITLAFGALTGINTVFSQMIIVLSKTKEFALISVLTIFQSIALVPVLLFPYGISGMAAIRGLSGVTSFALTVYVVSKVLRPQMDFPGIAKAWASSIAMAAAVYGVQAIWFSKYLVPLYVLVGGATYFFLLKVTRAVKESDVELFEIFLGTRLRLLAKPVRYLLSSSSGSG
jgi:O-antigen/teichoic acid export membrane protein